MTACKWCGEGAGWEERCRFCGFYNRRPPTFAEDLLDPQERAWRREVLRRAKTGDQPALETLHTVYKVHLPLVEGASEGAGTPFA